jgi:phytoene dehydrogenase-like protein
MSHFDLPDDVVAIAGGGLAGLVALADLSRAKIPAVLFEKSETIGGRAKTDVLEAFAFNLGAHALYRSGAARSILDDLGVRVTGHKPPVSGGFAIAGGKKHTMPGGLISTLVSDLLPLSAKLELAPLARRLQKRETAEEDARPEESFHDWMERRVPNPALRMFLGAVLRVSTYTPRARDISARSALTQIRMGIFDGVDYLDGGWGMIVQELERCAIEAGGKIVRGVRVDRVVHDARVRAIELAGGEHIPVRAAILAMPPRAAAALLSADAKAWLEGESLRAIPATAACLDVALRRLPDPRARFALGIDRPLYFSVHSATAKLAPEGMSLVQLMKYGDGAPEDKERDRSELEALLDLMQPGWRREVVHARFLPEMVAAHAIIRPSGFPARPEGTVPGVEDLFVAGDWVGSAHHLADAACASARAQTRRIAAKSARSMAA